MLEVIIIISTRSPSATLPPVRQDLGQGLPDVLGVKPGSSMAALGPACLLLVALLALQAQSACVRNGIRCLDYDVLQKNPDYEIRMYPATIWVSTSAEAKSRDKVLKKMIKKLYHYLQGANVQNITLPMMIPVRTFKSRGSPRNSYVLSLPLPESVYLSPPQPSDPQVFLHKETVQHYAVRSFEGQVRSEGDWDAHAARLTLDAAGDSHIDPRPGYYRCAYDSPRLPPNERLNEVWLPRRLS